MKRIGWIAILVGVVPIVMMVQQVCSEDREGGYVIGYPSHDGRDGGQVGNPVSRPVPALPVPPTTVPQEEPVSTTTVPAAAQAADSGHMATLKRQLAYKDQQIRLLEEQVARMAKDLESKEQALFQMQPLNRRYEVRKGDSLWKIAKRKETYGNPYMWIKIYNANMNKIHNPNVIYAGQLFDIPQ